MYNVDIKKLAKENTNFREVVHTGKYSQLVLMNIPVGEEIGNEVHNETDQLLVFIGGEGEAILNNTEKQKVEEHSVVFVPAGTWHNFINTGDEDLKLFTIYAPPTHKDGTVHVTRQDADREEGYAGGEQHELS